MKKINNPKLAIYLIVAVVCIVAVYLVFFGNSRGAGVFKIPGNQGDCSQFSNKDGYTGCMSLTNGKEKRCKFKVENKINESTQQMEFTYLCLPK